MKILIVDDCENNRELLKDIITEQNFDISEAENGDVALSMVENASYDLILLDIIMPIMNGFEVCHILKENSSTKDIPIIFLSASDELDHKIKAFELGAVDYISKPFIALEVIARINTHLKISGMFKQMKELYKYSMHELNTPLSVIQTSLDLQKLEYGSTEHLTNIQASSLIIQSSYEDIYYSMNREIVNHQTIWIELEQFLKDRIIYFKPLINKKSLSFKIYSNVDSPMMNISLIEATRLFDNLISNAIKYSDEESEIGININFNNGENIINIYNYSKSVNDTSRFIEDSYREKSSVIGLGLGLSIVRQICKKYNYKIQIELEDNRVNCYLIHKVKT